MVQQRSADHVYHLLNQWVMWRTKVAQIMHFRDKLTGICRSRILILAIKENAR